MATFTLAAHIQAQLETRHPARGQVEQGLRRALHQLELDLAHRQTQRAGTDLAFVQRQLDQRALVAHAAPGALHGGGVMLAQRGVAGARQHLAQARAGLAAVVAGDVQHRRGMGRQRHVVFQALQRHAALGLEGLHPALAFLAQAQRHAGAGQVALGGFHVAGGQRQAPGAGRGHAAAQCRQTRRGDAELQLDLMRHAGDGAMSW